MIACTRLSEYRKRFWLFTAISAIGLLLSAAHPVAALAEITFLRAPAQSPMMAGQARLFQCESESLPTDSRAQWLRGNWGVRFVMPCGDSQQIIDFDVNQIVQQVSRIKSAKWVMINLSLSVGGYYSSPHPLLEKEIDTRMAPKRDLFEEFLDSLKASGFYVIVYFASQGPSTDFLSNERIERLKRIRGKFIKNTLEIGIKWEAYLTEHNLTNQQGVAEVILKYYSKRFGEKIDAWWFDHGKWGDYRLYAAAARIGNPNAAIAWNERHDTLAVQDGENSKHGSAWMLTRSNSEEDFTDGHVTPTTRHLPWWQGNELAIRQIESCANISGAVPHYFVPLQSTWRGWRGGKENFPLDQSISWTLRTLSAGGSITWAAALSPPEFKKSTIARQPYELLIGIDQAVLKAYPALRRDAAKRNSPKKAAW